MDSKAVGLVRDRFLQISGTVSLSISANSNGVAKLTVNSQLASKISVTLRLF